MVTPMAWRIIGSIAFLLVVFTAGYFFGWKSQHDSLVRFREQVAAEGRIQAQQSHQKEVEQNETTKAIQDDYSAERAALFAKLDRLRNINASRSAVSAPSGNACPTIDPDWERTRACGGTEFYRNALDCELKLKGIREWVIREHIPVR